MLKDLEILNGELSVKFDPLNTRYTVNMNNAAKCLDLKLDADEESDISVFNNEINDQFTEVVITVYHEDEMMSYYLEVYPMENEVSNVQNNFETLEINLTEPKIYIAPLIASACFLIILLNFSLLFKKKKKC